MGRVRILVVSMVSSALMLLAVSAQAGGFNRPDLLDVDDSSSYTGTGSSLPFSWAWMTADYDDADVSGSMSGSIRDSNHLVRVWSQLYQPDTTRRNHRSARINQKRYVNVWVALYTVSGTVDINSGFPEKCKGAMRADDRDRDGNYNLTPLGDDRIRGRLRCPRDVLSDLGFSAANVDIIQNLIGRSTKFNIKLP